MYADTTHILHAVVMATLGDHARQQGSLVEPDRLRFDFAHFAALTPDQLARIETAVNGHVLDDPQVRAWHADRAEAEAAGAIALFGEKYGDTVRIVDIGDFSRELCGGTHVSHGSQVGAFRLLSESSIGSNLRRVEALTGHGTLRRLDTERRLLNELSGLLGTRPAEAPGVLRKRPRPGGPNGRRRLRSRGPLASAGGRRPEALSQALDLAAQEATRLLGGR
ncbi:hypothetical protein [Streptomyces sp. NPDC001020]